MVRLVITCIKMTGTLTACGHAQKAASDIREYGGITLRCKVLVDLLLRERGGPPDLEVRLLEVLILAQRLYFVDKNRFIVTRFGQ